MNKKVRYYPLLQSTSDTDSDVDIFNAKNATAANLSTRKNKVKKGIFISLVLVVVIVCTTVSVTVHSTKTKLEKIEVETECGRVGGVEETINPGNKISYSFKGIPYAKQPVDNLRWHPSERLNKHKENCWKGVYEAHTFGSQCFQGSGGSEECLYLNVVTPTLNNAAKLPVFVWIHGGYLMTGNGTGYGYSPDGEFVTSMGVVGVSMNYRLNAFGFLTLKELWEDDKSSYGNYGFSDQILVLKWVQANIKNFGGDPKSVTICGQSSGGTSIFGLLASPMSDGLFHKAIPMSGSPKFQKSYVEAAKDNRVFITNTKCKIYNTTDDIRSCLYSLSAKEVFESIPEDVYPYWAMEDLLDFPTKNLFDGAVAVIDSVIVTYPPKDAFSFKFSTNVSVLIGNTAQEIGFQPKQRFVGPNAWNNFHTFLKQRTSDLTGFIDNVWGKLYTNGTNQDSESAQIMYETMATDVRCTCPTNKLAKDFMKSPYRSVYRYVTEYSPGKSGVKLPMFQHPLKHSFHVIDAAALFGFKMFQQFGYKITENDLVFTKSVRKVFLDFIKNGNLEVNQWKPGQTGVFQSDGKLNVLEKHDYHEEECKYWNNEKNGFVPYAWIN